MKEWLVNYLKFILIIYLKTKKKKKKKNFINFYILYSMNEDMSLSMFRCLS